jgi:hypothetical protein
MLLPLTATHQLTTLRTFFDFINGVFHPDNYETFLTLNDRNFCKDFDYGNGSNNSNFLALVADYINDATNLQLDGFRVIIDYDNYIKTACSQQTGASYKSMIEGLTKVRGTMIASMTTSSDNANDLLMYGGSHKASQHGKEL